MKRVSIISGIILSAIGGSVVSCSSDSSRSSNMGIPPVSEFKPSSRAAALKSKVPGFAESVFKATIEQPESEGINTAISPLSLQIALAMVANSCDDATNARIAKLLGYESVDNLNEFTNQQMRYLTNTDVSGLDLKLANSIWLTDSFEPNVEILNLLDQNFYAQSQSVNFSSKETLNLINGWVKEKTDGLIPNIFDDFNSNTLALFINALYLEGKWQIPFNKENTTKKMFMGLSKPGLTDMMSISEELMYCNSGDDLEWQSVSLKFKGENDTWMSFILPEEGSDFKEFTASFKTEDINAIINESAERDIILNLPKFEFSYKIDLTNLLVSMGVDNGNVTLAKLGIDRNIDLKGSQQSFTKVDEEGAKVAVTTQISGWDSEPTPPQYIRLDFNRPFMFMVHNQTTGAIILMGTIKNL